MRIKVFSCLLSGSVLLLALFPAWAADSRSNKPAAITLGEVVVSGARENAVNADEEAATLGSYEHEVSAGDRARTSDAGQLLSDAPGVSLQQNGGVATLPVIHGMADDRIRIKVDGMDLISSCPNHMNSPLSYIDPAKVDVISVTPGITPVSMGGDSIGGTILVNSAAPEFAKKGKGLLLKGRTGAFYRSNGDAVGANLSVSAATESLSFRYSGSMTQSGNYYSADDFKAAGPAAVDRGWLDGDEVGSSRFLALNHAAAFALKRGRHLLQLNIGIQHIPYEGFPNQRMDMTDNYSEQINLLYSGHYSWGMLEARFYNERTRHKMDFADDKQFLYGSPSTILAPGMPMNTKSANTGAMIKGEVRLSEIHLLRSGVEAQWYRLDDWWPPSPSALPPGYAFGGMAPDTFLSINDGRRDRLAAYAEWEAGWTSRWLSLFGVRAEMVTMDTGKVHGYNNTFMYNGSPLFPATTFNQSDRDRADHNYDLTALARYTHKAGEILEFGYARKTRSPNLYERYAWSINTMAMEMINFSGDGNYYVGNLDLDPEVAHTLSATADWHDPAASEWGLKVTPYYTYVEDYIDVRRCPTTVCGNTDRTKANLTAKKGFVYLQFVNQDAQLYGVDISGHYLLAKTERFGNFSARGLVNFVRGENRTTGDNLYNIMPLNAKAAIVHQFGKWTNTVEGQLVDSKRDVSQARNEVKTSGYGLLHLRSSHEWKNLRLDAGVENLFDKHYELPLGGAYVGQGATMSGGAIPWGVPVPGAGRSFYIALTVTF